jgi:hypothetical protein
MDYQPMMVGFGMLDLGSCVIPVVRELGWDERQREKPLYR